MNKIGLILFLLGMRLLFSCAEKIDLETPPESKIFSVTDMALTGDGGYLVVLSSNFDRRYDFGRVSVYDLAEKKVVSSVLVDSIGGRLLISPDERYAYVTTREWGRLHALTLDRGAKGYPSLSYGLSQKLDAVSYGVHKEPYAMALSDDGARLFVSHLRNGEVDVFQQGERDLTYAGTFEVDNAVTAVVFDAAHEIFISAHKSKSHLGMFRITADEPEAVSVAVGTVPVPVLNAGDDIRDIVPSGEASRYYLSARNIDSAGDEFPAVVKIALVESSGGVRAELLWATPLDGDLAEAAVVPCGGGEMLFVAAPDEEKVFVVEGERGMLAAQAELDGCTPYQVYSCASDAARRLFVGCFAENRILVLDGDCASDTFLSVLQEIP